MTKSKNNHNLSQQLDAPGSNSNKTAEVATIPFELYKNNIYIEAMINSEPIKLILDTGAGASIISLEHAHRMGLNLKDRIEVSGAGAGSIVGNLIEGASFNFKGIDNYSLPILLALPMSDLKPYAGRELSGIIGYDLFKRFIVEVDYERRLLKLYEPVDFKYSGDGERIPLSIKMNHPHITAKILKIKSIANPELEEISCDAVIDLGSGMSLTLTREFVQIHNLLDSLEKKIDVLMGVGAGGRTDAFIGRLGMKIGSYQFEDTIIGFSRDEKGVMASSKFFEANIGAEILRRFKVIFDYSRSVMILEPNIHFNEAYDFDMSGLYLITDESGALSVSSIIADSPASEAGFEVGDLIIAIDGKSADSFNLDDLRSLFKSLGKSYLLRVNRKGEIVEKSLSLRRLI